MNFDFSTENEKIIVSKIDGKKVMQRQRRKSMRALRENLRKCAVDRILGNMGDC